MTGRLLYDPDCGFCTASAHWLQGLGLDATVEPMTPALLSELGVDAERAAREIPFVADNGTVSHGARAIGLALTSGPAWCRPVGWLLVHPPVRWLADPAYRLVARYRHRLPGGTGACRLNP